MRTIILSSLYLSSQIYTLGQTQLRPRGFSNEGVAIIEDIAIKEQIAYATNFGLRFDFPSYTPSLVGTISAYDLSLLHGKIQFLGSTILENFSPDRIEISGTSAFVLDSWTNSLRIFDISNPLELVEQSMTGLSQPADLAISENSVFVVDSTIARIQAFDISDPQNPIALDFDQTGLSEPTAISESKTTVLTCIDRGTESLQIFDISNPSEIAHIGSYESPIPSPFSISVKSGIAYVGKSRARA